MASRADAVHKKLKVGLVDIREPHLSIFIFTAKTEQAADVGRQYNSEEADIWYGVRGVHSYARSRDCKPWRR